MRLILNLIKAQKNEVTKAKDAYHLIWDKYAQCRHVSNLPEVLFQL